MFFYPDLYHPKAFPFLEGGGALVVVVDVDEVVVEVDDVVVEVDEVVLDKVVSVDVVVLVGVVLAVVVTAEAKTVDTVGAEPY